MSFSWRRELLDDRDELFGQAAGWIVERIAPSRRWEMRAKAVKRQCQGFLPTAQIQPLEGCSIT